MCVTILCVCFNQFLNFFNFLSVFPSTYRLFGPCTFICHLPCQKYSRPWTPQPPVTHTVCGPGCRRLVRPHISRPHSLKNQLHSACQRRPVVRKECCPGSDRAVTKTTTTRVRVPVVMHVFHINKIVILTVTARYL